MGSHLEGLGGPADLGDVKLADCYAVVAQALSQLRSFDGEVVDLDPAFIERAVERWKVADKAPLEAETVDGRWKLLTAHPRAEGGVALISADITALKTAQLAHAENAEIFRCITDSHPLPVWVVDEESGRILYESLDASNLLGRKWRADKPMRLTDHFADAREYDKIRKLVGRNKILRDHDIQLRRANGSTAWCATNCRRGSYKGRRALVLGVLDVTARKQREELFAFLIEHHPLPVWMSDATTGEVIYLSSAADQLLGWNRRPDKAGGSLKDYFVDPEEYWEIGRELHKNGFVETCEARLKNAEGQEFWATGNLRMVDFHGRQVVLVGIADLTKQKQRAGEVAMARELLANAVEALSEGFALYDEDNKLVMCNSIYRELNEPLGYMIKPGLDWRELLREGAKHGLFLDAIGREEEWLQGRVRDRISFHTHYEVPLSNGGWHSVSIHPTDLGGFAVTRADISERKWADVAERDLTTRLQGILDACPSAMRMSTIDGETLYRNPASRDLYGDRPQLVSYYANPDDRAEFLRILLQQGRIDDFRVRQYAADDSIFWGSISARLVDFQGRQVIVSNTTNITDMIVAQEETRHASERLIDAIESLAEGFALYDKDDRLVLANSQYRKMHAMSVDMLYPGVNWFDFLRVAAERKQFPVRPDQIDAWLAERARDRHEFRQQEFQHSDGGWFYVSNCPTREGGFVVTRVDITERKRAELAAKEADALVRRVLEACPVNIQMIRAQDGSMLYRSPATVELLGDAVNADCYVNPADGRRYMEKLLREGSVDDFEAQLWRKDGRPCWCSISSRLIDFHGEQVIVSHTYDLTDRIEMQQELERQRETLHQNEKLSALGGLLAGVAHELNNPLSVVLGMSLILKETSTEPKTLDRADKISKAAERCARIVKTFLAMARQQPARTSNIAIGEVVTASLEVAGYAIRSSDISLSVDIEPDLPMIWADPDQLSQVLINLLVNAEQALHGWEGVRKIAVSARRNSRNGQVVIKVADSGPGVAEDILPRIFEPFFTTKEVGAGTGIGLSFCYRIVQSHGGTIHVEANAGGGSIFVMTLPPSQQPDELPDEMVDETIAASGLACLVVEDEPEVGELIAEVLKRDGFNVTLARSGEQALAALARQTFALILSDLKMPNMDGRRLFNHISDRHPSEVEKLVFLTGDTISPDAQVFLGATKRPFLEKPIRPDELRLFVSRMVEGHVD